MTRARIFYKLVLRLYPRTWRERYEEEMLVVAASHPFSFGESMDLVRGALDVYLHPDLGTITLPRDERSRQLLTLRRSLLLTLVGDVVAMLRHLPAWTGRPGTGGLMLVVSGMGLLGSLVGISAVRTHRRIGAPRPPREWAKAILVVIAMVAILAFYPEQIIHDNVGELVTVVVGAVLLYVPMWAWGESLVPAPREQSPKIPERSRLAQWLMVILIAMGIGLVLVLGEATESGGGKQGIQVFHALHVVAVYVGLEVAAVLIGYGLLHAHLGLFRSTETIGERRKVEQGG